MSLATGRFLGLSAIFFVLGSTMKLRGSPENSTDMKLRDIDAGTPELDCKTGPDARPGTPTLDNLGPIILNQLSDLRSEMGDRLLKAAEALEAMRYCNYFTTFGDYTWCDRAMPAETEYARQNRYPVHICEVPTNSFAQNIQKNQEVETRQSAKDAGYLGLSYGIFTSDPWSELMSNMYFMPTVLHDCYYSGDEGPLANDLHAGHSEKEPCNGRHCYSVPYIGERVCMGKVGVHDGGRRFEPLSQHLQGRGNLSTFVKMDVEGAEWSQLEQLLENEEDIMKIRTLDMEVHFNMDQDDDWVRLRGKAESPASLERKVQIMEKLAQKFAVTGSTLQPLFKNEKKQYDKSRSNDPSFKSEEPMIYTSKGYDLEQYCISFMNRQLL